MGRPPKKDPYLRPNDSLPKVGDWHVNAPEILTKIDRNGDIVKVLSVMFAPVEMIVPHGNASMVYYDQQKIKLVEQPFKTCMLQGAEEFVKSLRSMADQIEMLVKPND